MPTFNPPPNWPQPPENWSPPAGWRPDPAWGPAPEGWQLWVEEQQPTPNREKRIFISYRRNDCQPQANAINDGLRHRMPNAHIFMDIDSIPVGVDFEKHVKEEIEVCDVVLVVMGDDWLTETTRDGERRIDDPNDFVRLEVEAALAAPRVSVVPVLVEGAEMPRQSQLPETIRDLSRINAIELSDRRWTADIERLAGSIRELEEYQQKKAQRAPGVDATGNGPIATAVAAPVPAPVRAEPATPTPVYQPPVYQPPPPSPAAYSVATPYAAPRSSDSNTLGWVMVAIPVVSCGMLAFVPSIWVASVRRARKDLMMRALAIAGAFIVLLLVGFVLLGTAPTDEDGTPIGAASNIGVALLFVNMIGGSVLAGFQRRPSEVLAK